MRRWLTLLPPRTRIPTRRLVCECVDCLSPRRRGTLPQLVLPISQALRILDTSAGDTRPLRILPRAFVLRYIRRCSAVAIPLASGQDGGCSHIRSLSPDSLHLRAWLARSFLLTTRYTRLRFVRVHEYTRHLRHLCRIARSRPRSRCWPGPSGVRRGIPKRSGDNNVQGGARDRAHT